MIFIVQISNAFNVSDIDIIGRSYVFITIKTFHTKYVHKCVINIHVQSYIPSPNIYSYYAAEQRRFLKFYTITRKITRSTKLLCYGRRQNATLSDATITYTTEVRMAAMSVLLLVERNITSVNAEGIRVCKKFLENPPNSSTVI